MADNTNTTTNNTTATALAPKRASAFNAGLEKMRDAKVLSTASAKLQTLAKLVEGDKANLAFDLLYVNLPWKAVSLDYAATLPVQDLVQGKEQAGLLLWVDSPCVDKAVKLLDVWGFTFHSVVHVAAYTPASPTAAAAATATPQAPSTPTAAAAAAAGNNEEGKDEAEDKDKVKDKEETTGAAPTTTTTTATATKKNLVPHGWMVDGLVPSKTRQLWFAVRSPAGGNEAAAAAGSSAAFLKDVSFIRKRVQATSTIQYSKFTEAFATALSSKKKNLDHWVVYPEYDAFVAQELQAALETIHKPHARVLSLFADTLSRAWYAWGPNIPGYVSCPLRTDGGFPVVHALLKYFGSMKGATVQKYLTLMNLYAVQLAKHMGAGAVDLATTEGEPPKQYLTPVVVGRVQDFFTDLLRRYQEGGGIKECPLAQAQLVALADLADFGKLAPEAQTQVLLLVGQVIRGVLRKNAEATERRKRAVKRKREEEEAAVGPDGQPVAPRERPPRKFGIAAPVNISKELAQFMGLNEGEKVARTTVVKFINEYIGKHSLQNPTKKSEINCDESLLSLLKPSSTFGPVTYFNLCKLLGPHFNPNTNNAAGNAADATAMPVSA